jgi:predicted kinase
LETASDLLRKRVASRSSSPSDADLSVLGMQLERQLEPVAWRKLDAARPVEALIADVLE